MTINVLDIDISKHSQSWVAILGLSFGQTLSEYHLFYIEWTSAGKIAHLELFYFFRWVRDWRTL